MSNENAPKYTSSVLEKYLNYLSGSSDDLPNDKPSSRLEEYLQYICTNGTAKEREIIQALLSKPDDFIVFPDGYMPSSTLPSIQVPKITAEQVHQILTAKSQGKVAMLSMEDGTHDVVETCLLEGQESFKIFYCNYLVEYVVDGDNVIPEYIALNFNGD